MFSQLDALTEGTINASISDTAAALATKLGNLTAEQRNALFSQATNVAITSYSGQNLSDLSDVGGSTTFELMVDSSLAITHAQAAYLNSLDKITITGNDVSLTLSGESFDIDNKTSHFATLSSITSTGSNASVTVEDYGTSSDSSSIDLKPISTFSGISTFTVEGDTGAVLFNYLQRSHNLVRL